LKSILFLKAYVLTMRPYLLFLSGITGVAGVAMATDVRPARATLIAVVSFLSYGFGQALTDTFQIDTDRISSPYRPLVRGTVSRAQVMAVSLAGLLLCVGVFAVLHPLNALLGVLAGAGLTTYTFLKRRWWGGPWYNAWIVAVLFVMGYLAGKNPDNDLPSDAFPWTLFAVFFLYSTYVLAGYFKDITADAKTGYITLPVRFGRGVSRTISHVLATSGLIFLILAFLRAGDGNERFFQNVLPWSFLIAALGTGVAAQLSLRTVRRDEAAFRAIALVVHAYILGLSAVCASAHPSWTGILALAYAAFVLTLNARPSEGQI
jgi:geranylgeranylglycerol-phosphate geranylgeranyltransferase